jgi:small subunit ribosomal protein S8
MLDLISDTLTRIRNGQNVRSNEITLYNPISKFCLKILNILYKEGYIRGFVVTSDDKKQKICVKVLLKYDFYGNPVIKQLKRISKPSRRVYVPIKSL